MTDFNLLPDITLTIADRERLERLVLASIERFPTTADYLAREIERARIIEPHQAADDLVLMGSCVDFRDDATGQVRQVTLVYPHEADLSAGRISVMTPVGAALIGLSKNQSIEWQTPGAEWRSLTVLSVTSVPAESRNVVVSGRAEVAKRGKSSKAAADSGNLIVRGASNASGSRHVGDNAMPIAATSMDASTAFAAVATSPLEEPGIVERAKRGDEDAFRIIMTQNNRRLYRVARALLGDDIEAEDVVQETYLRAFVALPDFRGEASLSTWLTRITLNEALRRRRKHRPTFSLEAVDGLQESGAEIIQFPDVNAGGDPERSAALGDIRKLLESAIDALPEPFRMVCVLRDVEELSIRETAAFLGIRAETVKTRLHRARLLLRQSLGDQLVSVLQGAFPFAGSRCAQSAEAVLNRLQIRSFAPLK
jgi:RNA polymerase sigma-70 factor, ECF subfamily